MFRDETSQPRHDRLRFHGQGPLQRLLPGQPLFRPPIPSGAQGGLRPQRRQGQGLRLQLGLRVGRDRLAQADRTQGHRRHRHLHAEQHPRGDRVGGGSGRQEHPVRKAAGHERPRRAEDGRGGREGRRRQHGLVQLPPRAGRDAGQEADRRGQARPHLPLPGQVPPGLDDQPGTAAGRGGAVAAGRGGGRQRRHWRPAGPLHRHRPLDERRPRRDQRHDRDLRQGTQAPV